MNLNKFFHLLTAPFRSMNNLRKWLTQIGLFSILLIFYLSSAFFLIFANIRFMPGPLKRLLKFISNLLLKPLGLFNKYQEHTINRLNLIDLAIKNMMFKKTRAVITVGGMALGIGSIVFLVSLGYGINKLVIDRVARLEEMQQADINPQPGSQVRLTDQSLSQFKNIPDVAHALPQIAVVAKVNYQNSVSDMAVYGVTAEYLNQSAVKPIEGKIFENNELSYKVVPGQVAGITISKNEDPYPFEGKSGQKIRDIEYDIDAEEWLKVREGPSTNAKLLGYTRQIEGRQLGQEVWGDKYAASVSAERNEDYGDIVDDEYGKWIKSKVLIWEKEPCTQEVGCESGNYQPILEADGRQKEEEVFFAQIKTRVYSTQLKRNQVLGVTSDSDEMLNLLDTIELQDEAVLGTSSAELSLFAQADDSTVAPIDAPPDTLSGSDDEWIEIASEAGVIKQNEVKQIALGAGATKEAVVNTAMLNILGITADQAVGKSFETSFIVTGDLLDSDEKVESLPETYTIVGVVPEDNAPFFYVPFMDLRTLGITNFSQAKIVVKSPNSLAQVRRQVEAIGFATASVADTVEQIDRLFGTLRSVLALLGMVALAVASLGMFNTLTVSLLERTREVGLMKAMGMKSSEVRELFLTESMIMGFFGGVLGIFFGFAGGKLLSLGISAYSLVKGQGFIDISYIPTPFVIIVFVLSLCVGVFTGIYPARRATKISALNALRYE